MSHSIIIPSGSALISDGQSQSKVQHQELSPEEAAMLRRLKRFLQERGLSYELYCNDCRNNGFDAQMAGGVMPDRIGFACKHRMMTFLGNTF